MELLATKPINKKKNLLTNVLFPQQNYCIMSWLNIVIGEIKFTLYVPPEILEVNI
jgi:hypothetical protein